MFGAVSLTKHIDIDQYKYSGYGIRFDRKGEISFGSNGFCRNVIIFGADMSSSVHANSKTKNILVLGKDFIQGIDNTAIYVEKMYSINFTGTDIHNFKVKDSEIVVTPLCLGNISKDFSADDMKKKTGLNAYVYDFGVDYDAIAVDDILDIHKYLMEKNNIK